MCVLWGFCHPTQSWLDQLWIRDSCWTNQNPYPGCLGLGLEDFSSFWMSLERRRFTFISNHWLLQQSLIPIVASRSLLTGCDGTGSRKPGDSSLLSLMVISWKSSLPCAKNWDGVILWRANRLITSFCSSLISYCQGQPGLGQGAGCSLLSWYTLAPLFHIYRLEQQ